MKKILIADTLIRICSNIQLGCIQYESKVEEGSDELWERIFESIRKIKSSMTMGDIIREKHIESSRKVYKDLGKDPHRYRISSEALIRRIVQGKDLYRVNNIVDANNLISINSRLSVGSYDVEKLGDSLRFRIGKKDESYKGIGKSIINTENLPVFSDEFGVYGSPTSDSERAMITNCTKKILTVLISFSDDIDLNRYVDDAIDILSRYVGAKNIEYCILGSQR